MRRRLFYPRMALQNVTKNRRFFYPFIMTCAVLSAMFYDLFFLVFDSGLADMRQIASFMPILMLGLIIVTLFALIFLLYSNGFLMKNRKRELGLYNILGMQKRNIAHMMLWEMCYSAFFGILGGLISGIALSKLALMTLFKLLGFNLPMGFKVSLSGILVTAVVFGFVMIVCLLYNILCLRLSKPIELLRATSSGEREPKTKWIIAVVGILTLGGGYAMALSVDSPLTAIALFFVAVILVIIGTYCLFTAGSIAILKALRKNKGYYYKPTHFTAVSGMLYRMKQNAAGLASICILSTMVLVVISTTVCLYTGVDGILDARYPTDYYVDLYIDDPAARPEDAFGIIDDTLEEFELAKTGLVDYSYAFMSCSINGDTVTFDNYYGDGDNALRLTVIAAEQYSRLTGESVSLNAGEALAFTDGFSTPPETLNVAAKSYKIIGQLATFLYYDKALASDRKIIYLVVPDYADINAIYLTQSAAYGEHASDMRWQIRFDVPGERDKVVECFDAMVMKLSKLRKETESAYFSLVSDCRQKVEGEFMAIYGGLFFVGLFLGILFLMATALIIYYKQITEGYDDRRRFEIMQQVGMSLSEVKKTVRGQILTVFFLPLLVACLHLAGAFNMISLLLSMFDLTNVGLFFTCCAVTAVVFAAGYAVIYTLTARTYYKIIRT